MCRPINYEFKKAPFEEYHTLKTIWLSLERFNCIVKLDRLLPYEEAKEYSEVAAKDLLLCSIKDMIEPAIKTEFVDYDVIKATIDMPYIQPKQTVEQFKEDFNQLPWYERLKRAWRKI